MAISNRLPVFFIPHGGGPWPFMEPPTQWGADPWKGLADFLQSIPASLGSRPKAILIVSGHWEDPEKFTVSTAEHPGMMFDYSGFPAHTYQLSYPAPGSPSVAARVRDMLAANGIESQADAERGYDHGVFVPLMVAFPEADIPVVMLSLQRDLDAATHFAMGAALEPLRDEGILIIGSGMSYHNMRLFGRSNEEHAAEAMRFDDWLRDAVGLADPVLRNKALAGWVDNPDARACHVPDHDHLVPVFVAAGAAGRDPGIRVFNGRVLGKPYSGFRFG